MLKFVQSLQKNVFCLKLLMFFGDESLKKIFPSDLGAFCSSNVKLSVIRQKGESQNWCFKKTKHAKCSFFGKFGMFCFLETPALRFALLPY